MAKIIKMSAYKQRENIKARITKHVAKTKAAVIKSGIVKDFSLDKPELSDDDKLLLAQVTEQEEKCLKTIHSRYCLIKMVPILITDVGRYVPDKVMRPNYWEYWYKHNSKDAAFLMSRELVIDGVNPPKLVILFNKELMREGEE